MQNQISVVILHYNDANVTLSFLKNLNSLNWNEISYHFIVVDNGSPDGSGQILANIYKNDPIVTVILNKKNLGFAKGNNIGICYAWKKFNSDFIIVSNNDIRITDNNFPQLLLSISSQENFAVIGPDIYSLSKGMHQSPIRQKPLDAKQLKEKIHHIDYTLCQLYAIRKLHLYDFISRAKKVLGIRHSTKGNLHEKTQKNVVLQGAFFILGQEYMKHYPKGLYDQTFLYMEEDILAYQCQKKQLNTLYTPKLSVLHIDGYATIKQEKNRCNKYIFELIETKKSCQIMLNMLLNKEQ